MITIELKTGDEVTTSKTYKASKIDYMIKGRRLICCLKDCSD